MPRFISEKSVYIFLFLILAFMWLTFNRDIASIYGLFLMLDYIIYDSYPTLKYKINGVMNNTMTSILFAGLAMVIFLGISYIAAIFLQSASPILQGNFITHYLKIFSQTTPILAGNKFLSLLGWGIVIPVIETRLFFGRLFDLSAQASNTNTSYFNKRLVILFIIIATLFTYFHFQVRGLADNVGLMGTFIFAIISLTLIVQRKELESAIWFHVFWNSWISYKSLYP